MSGLTNDQINLIGFRYNSKITSKERLMIEYSISSSKFDNVMFVYRTGEALFGDEPFIRDECFDTLS